MHAVCTARAQQYISRGYPPGYPPGEVATVAVGAVSRASFFDACVVSVALRPSPGAAVLWFRR